MLDGIERDIKKIKIRNNRYHLNKPVQNFIVKTNRFSKIENEDWFSNFPLKITILIKNKNCSYKYLSFLSVHIVNNFTLFMIK